MSWSPIAAIRREYQSLPPVYWALWVGTLVNKTGNFVVPFLAIYVTGTLGLGEVAAGATVATYGAGNATSGIVGGVLADRIGRRATMLLSLFGGSIAIVALAFAHTVTSMAIGSFMMGFLAELYRPAVAATVADIVPTKDRQRAYGYLYWAVNLGFAMAPTLAGIAMHTSSSLLFVVDGLTLAAYGLVVLWRIPETRPAEAHLQSDKGSALSVIARDHVYLIFSLLCLATGMVMWQCGTTLPLDMAKHGISPETFGLLISINGVVIIVLQPVIVRLVVSRSRSAVLLVSALLFGAGFGMYAFVSSKLGYALGIIVWTIGEIASQPVLSAVAADMAPSAMRGRYQGVFTLAWGASGMLGPMLGGLALARLGARALWIGCFVLMTTVGLAHVAIGRARDARSGLP